MTITAKIIADSTDQKGVRIITFELDYPRFIHSELMTHRVFSRNSASSRAIPIQSMIDNIRANPATPIHWGKNQTGMQAKQELTGVELEAAQTQWGAAATDALYWSYRLSTNGTHKQIANRITEPFQHMKVVVTSTEWNNWFWLRNHPDAQPEIAELAKQMLIAMENSKTEVLKHGEWHLPYVKTYRDTEDSVRTYWDDEVAQITLQQAIMISASSCAQVSYRKNDTSLEKAEVIYKRLIESEPCHASPVEHQAMCYDQHIGLGEFGEWPVGYTHIDRKGQLWSNNFRSWIQNRALIPNNVKEG